MPSDTNKPTTSLPAARILLLSEDQEELETVRQHLELDGAEAVRVEPADSWQEVLDAAESREADLLLLDPDCYEDDLAGILDLLGEGKPLAETPVVLLADNGQMESCRELVESGALDFIRRPVDRADIRSRVGSQLRLKNLYDHVREQKKELEEM